MGFSIFSINDKLSYGIKNYVADTTADLENIPRRYPGSMVYVTETSKFYMLNNSKTWVEQKDSSNSEIDENQVNALIDAKINEVPTLPDPSSLLDNQVLMVQSGDWVPTNIPGGQTIIVDEVLSTLDNGHAISNKAVATAVNTINNAGYQTAADVQNIVTQELGDITSFEYYLCKIGEYSLETGVPIAEDLDETPDTQHIYLVPTDGDNLNMFAYINNDFVFLGTTEMDMSNYYDTTQVDNLLAAKADTIDLQDLVTLTDVSNAGYLTSVDWTTDITNKPTLFSGNYNDLSNLPINSSGETTKSLILTKPLNITGGDSASAGKLSLNQSNNGQITDSSTSTIFGFMNSSDLTVGSNSYALKLRGSGTKPTFNGNNLVLASDLTNMVTGDGSAYTIKVIDSGEPASETPNTTITIVKE